jgi:hypothetical protein
LSAFPSREILWLTKDPYSMIEILVGKNNVSMGDWNGFIGELPVKVSIEVCTSTVSVFLRVPLCFSRHCRSHYAWLLEVNFIFVGNGILSCASVSGLTKCQCMKDVLIHLAYTNKLDCVNMQTFEE